MVIRNITVAENYTMISSVTGPNHSKLALIVDDWRRFMEQIKHVAPGTQIFFEDKRDDSMRFEIVIVNADKGIKNLNLDDILNLDDMLP